AATATTSTGARRVGPRPKDSTTWVKDSAGAAAAGPASTEAAELPVPVLNEKQALAVELVRDHAASLDTYREAVRVSRRDNSARAAHPSLLAPPEPLRLLLTGTTGTGKTVVIREIERLVGQQRFILMAPTG
ncbi:unnamed protein product, partial [Ectocarpus fasciculatus]